MRIRNTKYNVHGTINCEIEHPKYGWIPFTASPDDVEAHGRAIFAEAQKLSPAPYTGPSLEQIKDQRKQRMEEMENNNPVKKLEDRIAELEARLDVRNNGADRERPE